MISTDRDVFVGVASAPTGMNAGAKAPSTKATQRWIVRICIAMVLGGCGGKPSAPATAAAQEPAVLQTADITIRASAVPTTVLGEAAAKQYGIERDSRTVLLLVGVRRGTESQETSLPARVRGSAVDLLGRRQQFELREIRSDGFIDYAGSVRISPPETLRFDLVIERDGAAPATLSFNRDFFP